MTTATATVESPVISNEGQITLSESVLKYLRLKSGDRVALQKENGRVYLEHPIERAFKQAEVDFAGAAEEAGFHNEEEMQDYVKEIRREVRGY